MDIAHLRGCPHLDQPLGSLDFNIHNMIVHKGIAIVYRNSIASKCRLHNFVIIVVNVGLFCTILFSANCEVFQKEVEVKVSSIV